jgi:hypothetical protein
MRTTVDIPDPLYLKNRAARERRSVKDLILRGVEDELEPRRKKAKRRISLPLIRSKRPGTVRLDNAKIFESMPSLA